MRHQRLSFRKRVYSPPGQNGHSALARADNIATKDAPRSFIFVEYRYVGLWIAVPVISTRMKCGWGSIDFS